MITEVLNNKLREHLNELAQIIPQVDWDQLGEFSPGSINLGGDLTVWPKQKVGIKQIRIPYDKVALCGKADSFYSFHEVVVQPILEALQELKALGVQHVSFGIPGTDQIILPCAGVPAFELRIGVSWK